MKFIDSNIIAYAVYPNENQEMCQQSIREGGILNTIVLIEAFNIIEHQTNKEHARDVIKSILKTNITIVNTDINLIFETMKRTEKNKLRFIDLVHYTTALMYNCEAILTYDKDFNNLDISREEPKN